jgi:hypothetical protein
MSDPRDPSFSNVPAPPAAPRPLPPAGWFADPGGRHEHRYWDGTAWTEHVADRGVAGVDPVANPAPATVSPLPAASTAGAPGVAPPPSVPTNPSDRSAWWAPEPGRVGPALGPVRSLDGLATALTVALWAAAGIAVLGVIALLNRVSVVNDMLDADSFFGRTDLAQRADDADSFVGIVGVLLTLVTLTIATLLIIWMWRVAKNSELLGRSDSRFKPGWTIGGWFIPFANLVIPVLVMQDLWRGSDPDSPRGDPLWRSRPGSALVGWWWAFYVASVVRIFFIRDDDSGFSDGDLRAIRDADLVGAFGMAVTIAAAILLIFVVRRITQRQRALIGALPPTT